MNQRKLTMKLVHWVYALPILLFSTTCGRFIWRGMDVLWPDQANRFISPELGRYVMVLHPRIANAILLLLLILVIMCKYKIITRFMPFTCIAGVLISWIFLTRWLVGAASGILIWPYCLIDTIKNDRPTEPFGQILLLVCSPLNRRSFLPLEFGQIIDFLSLVFFSFIAFRSSEEKRNIYANRILMLLMIILQIFSRFF